MQRPTLLVLLFIASAAVLWTAATGTPPSSTEDAAPSTALIYEATPSTSGHPLSSGPGALPSHLGSLADLGEDLTGDAGTDRVAPSSRHRTPWMMAARATLPLSPRAGLPFYQLYGHLLM